jgi:hypothetical protein
MARARNIKPGFFRNEMLAELSPLTRLLFAGLWTVADKAGRLEDRPKRIKADVLPYDDGDVDGMLSELADAGFILRYSIGESRYIQVLNFNKHQNPHIKEAESEIPAPEEHDTCTVQEPDENDACTVQGPDEHRTNPADSFNPDSFNPDSGFPHTLNGADALGRVDSSPKYMSDFETFWKAYPSGHGVKKKAFGQWKRIRAEERQAVMDGLEAWKSCDRWQRGFVKEAQTWLEDRQWEDEPPASPGPMSLMNGGVVEDIRPGPRGYTPDQLRRKAQQERLRESS